VCIIDDCRTWRGRSSERAPVSGRPQRIILASA
jgi:hypothetical protein